MKDGIINLDTERGKQIGFTSDKFEGYLWKNGNFIYISFIISRQQNKGLLSELFKTIIKQGYGIKVPTPLPKMEAIVKTSGFKSTKEWFPETNEWCEVWVKEVES